MPANVPHTRSGFVESPVGHWVGCLWNFESSDGKPHPEDAELIKQLCPYGVTTQCIATDGDFFVLRYRNHELRVRPFSIRILPFTPAYKQEERVHTIIGLDVKTELESTIRDIVWHDKRGEYAYFLDGDRRRRRRMYFEDQLEKAT